MRQYRYPQGGGPFGCKGGPHAAFGLAGGAREAEGGGRALEAEVPNEVPVGKLDGRVPEEEEEAQVGKCVEEVP